MQKETIAYAPPCLWEGDDREMDSGNPAESKRVLLPAACVFFVIFSLGMLVLKIVGWQNGYEFELYYDLPEAAVFTVAFLAMAVRVYRTDTTRKSWNQVFVSLLLPCMILVALFFVTRDGAVWKHILLGFLAVLLIVGAACLFFCCRVCLPYKITCGIVSLGLLLVFVLAIAWMSFCFLLERLVGELGETTVVKELSSPNQGYVAEVVDVDLGATGGDTIVRVSGQGKEIPLLIGKMTNTVRQVVYEGEWGEFQTMEIRWKDEHTLEIDGKEYDVE